MVNVKSDFKIDPRAVSVNTFARSVGLKPETILRYCQRGRILGAYQHPLTKKWWIHPPAKVLYP